MKPVLSYPEQVHAASRKLEALRNQCLAAEQEFEDLLTKKPRTGRQAAKAADFSHKKLGIKKKHKPQKTVKFRKHAGGETKVVMVWEHVKKLKKVKASDVREQLGLKNPYAQLDGLVKRGYMTKAGPGVYKPIVAEFVTNGVH